MITRLVLMGTGMVMLSISAHGATPTREDFRLAAQLRHRMESTVPFSFVYGNESSRQLLPRWTMRKAGRSVTYRDPRTGLEVEWTLTEYTTFPAFEWVLRFKNTGQRYAGARRHPRAGCDLTETVPGAVPKLEYGEGSHDELSDFAPGERALASGESAQFVSHGGRSSDGYLPYFQVRNPLGGNVVVGIGWTGQWSATFRHAPARGIAATAGMERTRLRLGAGRKRAHAGHPAAVVERRRSVSRQQFVAVPAAQTLHAPAQRS